MANVELAVGYVSIVPETSKVGPGIEAALAQSASRISRFGTMMGSEIGKGIAEGMATGTAGAFSEVVRDGEKAGDKAGKGLSNKIVPHARKAGRDSGKGFFDEFKTTSERSGALLGKILVAPMQANIAAFKGLGGLAAKTFRGALFAGLGSIGLGGGLGIGTIITKGAERLMGLDTAKRQIERMSKQFERTGRGAIDAKGIEKMLTNEKQTGVLDKTPFSLTEAMGAVQLALQGGVKQGEQLTNYMTALADAAGATQQPFGELALIFNDIVTKGSLATDEIEQLQNRMINIPELLKQAYGWNNDQLAQMLKDGKVGIEQVTYAIEQDMGGAAKSAGDTLQGAIENMGNAAGRVGAKFIAAVTGTPEDPLAGMKYVVDWITLKLNDIGQWILDHKDDLRDFFQRAKDVAGDVVTALGNIIGFLKEHPNLVKTAGLAFVGWQAISATATVATALLSINTALKAMPLAASAAILGLAPVGAAAAAALALYVVLKDNEYLGNQGFVGQDPGGGLLPPLGGFRRGGPFGPVGGPFGDPSMGGNISTGAGMVPPSGNAAQSILGGLAGVGPGIGIGGSSGGGGGGGILGTAGRGYFNSRAAATQLDGRLAAFDNQLLSMFPPGRYDNGAVSDLSQGLADCSSAIEDLINIIDGRSTAGREMTTFNAAEWLTSRGFRPGTAPGAFNVGFTNSGTPHMEATLPGGTNFNYGNSADAARNGRTNSAGAFSPQLEQRYYRYASGGGIRGAGTGTSDSIPALLSNGEHVLTAKDVQAMGGQSGVYSFRNALHRAGGGPVQPWDDEKLIFDENGDLFDGPPSNTLPPSDILRKAQKATATGIYRDSMNPWRWADFDGLGKGNFNPNVLLDTSNASMEHGWLGGARRFAEGGPPDDLIKELGTQHGALQGAEPGSPMDPMSQSHGSAMGAPPGPQPGVPNPEAETDPDKPNYGMDFFRSMGFIPASAGSTGVAGTSSLANFIDMGNSVVSGVIDTGVNLANTAVSAAITSAAAAGSFGAAAPAAPLGQMAASYGIQLAGNQAKRISSYWFGLAGIGADALVAQMNPFGAPRWLGYDYTQFAPQLGIQQAATSTIEKMGSDAIKSYFAPPGEANAAAGVNGAAPAAPVMPGPGAPLAPPVSEPNITAPPPEAALSMTPQQPQQQQPPGMLLPNLLSYDQGGMLPPGGIGINMTKRPEPVLTPKQWDAMANQQPAGRGDSPLVKIDTIYGMDPDDVARQIESKQKLAMMRFAGRP